MKTIGQVLKDARINKKYSLKFVEEITKIKSNFIDAIEEEKWDNLPSFPTVLGFVKNLSATVNIDEKLSVAILKRDYLPKKININPRQEIPKKFTWSPRLTFVVGIGAVILLAFGYLGIQYFKFISPPILNIESPKEEQNITGKSVQVFGETNTDAKITVNNQLVLVDPDGKFSVSIEVNSITKEIDIVATSRSGKMTEVKRKIRVE